MKNKNQILGILIFLNFFSWLAASTQLEASGLFQKVTNFLGFTKNADGDDSAEERSFSVEESTKESEPAEKVMEPLGTGQSRAFIAHLLTSGFLAGFNQELLNDPRLEEESLVESKLAVLNEIFEERLQQSITDWASAIKDAEISYAKKWIILPFIPFLLHMIIIPNDVVWEAPRDEDGKNPNIPAGFHAGSFSTRKTTQDPITRIPEIFYDRDKQTLRIEPTTQPSDHYKNVDWTLHSLGLAAKYLPVIGNLLPENTFGFLNFPIRFTWFALSKMFSKSNPYVNGSFDEEIAGKNNARSLINTATLIWGVPKFLQAVYLFKSSYKTYQPYIDGEKGFVINNIDLLKNYAIKRPFMPEAQQHYIDGMFENNLRFYTIDRSGIVQAAPDDGSAVLRKFLDVSLRMPLIRKELSFDYEKVMDLFHFYPADIKRTMAQFVFAQVRNEKVFATEPEFDDARFPLYLVGKPGTGKSHAAGLIAKGLGVPVARVNMDGATINDIVGLGFETNQAKPGRLLEAMTASVISLDNIGISNQVLLIDEFDRLLLSDDPDSKACLSFMLKLLDPDVRGFYSPFLKSHVKLPDTIILAGNFDLSKYDEEEHEAIRSRIEVVRFEGFEKEAKKDIIWTKVIPAAEERLFNIQEEKYRYSGMTDQEKEQIHLFLEKDTDPGLRSVLKFVQNTLEKSHRKQFLNQE